MPAIVIPAPINSNHVAPVAAGGTGANTAANARTNLDVYSKSEVTNAISQSTAYRPYSVMVYFGTATSCVIEYTLPTSYNNVNQILFYGRNGYNNAYGVIGVIVFSITDESSISVYKNGTGTVSASRSGNKITVTADAYSSLTFVSGYIPIKSA
jgi:hypothetical protein